MSGVKPFPQKSLVILLLQLLLVVKVSQQYKYGGFDGVQSMVELVLQKGYPIEIYDVNTDDGYILTTFRIPHGRNSTKIGRPVILQHGILCSSAVWVFGRPEQSLGFLLADRGYDVWLPNTRGTTYSRRHLKLDPVRDKKKFWDFSFHEMGYYDLPAAIDFVLKKTGEKRLYYIGHSQGTAQFFVMCSTRPEYNSKVRHMSALAPIAFMEHTRGGVQVLGQSSAILTRVAYALGWYAILQNTPWMQLFESAACKVATSPTSTICTDILFLIGGYDSDELNQELLPLITKFTPAGVSLKQLMHFSQLLKNGGKFTFFDYGIDNLKYYNRSTPPEYDLKKVRTPVMLHYSENDWIAGVEDVNKLAGILPNCNKKLVPFKKFNHLDFMWATHAYQLVFKDVIDEMRKF